MSDKDKVVVALERDGVLVDGVPVNAYIRKGIKVEPLGAMKDDGPNFLVHLTLYAHDVQLASDMKPGSWSFLEHQPDTSS